MNKRNFLYVVLAVLVIILIVLIVKDIPGGVQSGKQNNNTSMSAMALSPTTGSGVINVMSLPTGSSAKGDDISDDTSAFNKAIALASSSSNKSYTGPTGDPQGVVYVPVGSYRIKDVTIMNNVRLEIDAGAVIKQYAPTRVDKTGVGLFNFGKRDSTVRIDNVSIVGVGESSTYGGIAKPTAETGWDITHSFTLITDPVSSNASQFLKPFSIRYADGILIQNVFAIGNNSDLTEKTPGGVNSEERIISTGVRGNAPGSATTYYGPTNLTIDNLYFIGGQGGGGGAIQIQAGKGVVIKNVFSDGGIAARFESDGVGNDTLASHSCIKPGAGGGGVGCTCSIENLCSLMYISEISDVTVTNVMCKNGQGAVSLVPHNQINKNITITNVQSNNCGGTIFSAGTGDERLPPGKFSNVTIDGVTAIGSNYNGSGEKAQISKSTKNSNWTWSLAKSGEPICVKKLSVVEPITVNNCKKAGGEFLSDRSCESSFTTMCK